MSSPSDPAASPTARCRLCGERATERRRLAGEVCAWRAGCEHRLLVAEARAAEVARDLEQLQSAQDLAGRFGAGLVSRNELARIWGIPSDLLPPDPPHRRPPGPDAGH